MKTARPFLITACLLVVSAFLLRAEDWKTIDGKAYPGVTVIKVDPDAVTILYRDGGALVPLAQLPPDLQKRFHYDFNQARKAASARAQADAKSAAALQAEAMLAQKLKVREEATEKANAAKIKTTQVAAAGTDPAHHSEADLTHDDRNGPNHYDERYPSGDDDHRNTSGETPP
jgi:hypothetical protein